MKLKIILLSLALLFSGLNAEAQFLKKLKRKIEQVTERSIIKKPDEKVTETTRQVIDSVFTESASKEDTAEATTIENTQVKITDTNVSDSNDITDLDLEKTVDKSTAELGETVTFTISIRNYGPSDASGIEVLDKLPDGYTFIGSNVTSGNYNTSTGIWQIENLLKGKLVTLHIDASVGEGDLMNLAQIIKCDQTDPDSTVNNGVDTNGNNQVVDDPDDEDDGDGQDVKRRFSNASSNTSTNTTQDLGIKAVITDHKGESQAFIFDAKTVAMRVELGGKKKQPNMFFDNVGYVYTASKKNKYVKVPFEKLRKMMKFPTFVSGGMLPEIPFPDGSITYYGMDVSPHNFPILEWAWVYNRKHFENNPDVNKETLNCRGSSNCTKYTLKEGKDAGSFVLFDSKDRLAEILSINSGNAVYTYDTYNVTLPNAQEMPFMSDMFGN